jgi:2-keto-4-pentenoate hydratase
MAGREGSSRNESDPRVVAGMARQGKALQQLLDAGAARIGWKAGLGTSAAMSAASISAPLVGFLTSKTLVATGAEVDISGWGNPVCEPELAIRLAAAVAAGSDADTIAAAIDAVAPAIELVDLGPAHDVEDVLAGNIFHRAVVLGTWTPTTQLDAWRLAIRLGGNAHATDVDPATILGPTTAIVRAVADQVALAGHQLATGDVVITGSAIQALPLSGGEAVAVTVRGGGTATVLIS